MDALLSFQMGDDVTAAEDRKTAVRSAARTRPLPLVNAVKQVDLFRQARGSNYKAIAVAELAPEELALAIESPQLPLAAATTKVIKRGRSALIVQASFQMARGETRAAYKLCGSKAWARRVARSLQKARAVRNFHLGHKLLRHGIATPRPLLAVAPRWRAFLRPGFLATEWLEGTVPIDIFLAQVARLPAAKRQTVLRETASCVGQLVGTLHAHGFAHRDLKATNLLVRESQGRVEIFVIDLDGASQPWVLTRRVRRTNLARLVIATQGLAGMTAGLRRRALGAYLDSCSDPTPWKAVWRELREISRIRRSRRVARGQSRALGERGID